MPGNWIEKLGWKYYIALGSILIIRSESPNFTIIHGIIRPHNIVMNVKY